MADEQLLKYYEDTTVPINIHKKHKKGKNEKNQPVKMRSMILESEGHGNAVQERGMVLDLITSGISQFATSIINGMHKFLNSSNMNIIFKIIALATLGVSTAGTTGAVMFLASHFDVAMSYLQRIFHFLVGLFRKM